MNASNFIFLLKFPRKAFKFRMVLIPFWFKRLIKLKNYNQFSFLTDKCRKTIGLSTLLAATLLRENSTLDSMEHTSGDFVDLSHRKLIQQACSNSANSTSELLTQILLAVMDSASKYKRSLNHLMGSLEQSNELLEYNSVNPATEDDIIEARNQTKISKEEFWDLITMSEHIEKLATATAEVSFLIGAEILAMLVSERLYSIQQKIKNETEDVRKMENEYLELLKSSIEGIKEEDS